MLAGARVLVTGGAGFIGTGVVAALRASGAEPVVADLRDPVDADVEALVGDLRDPDVRARALTGRIDAVVHLAALTSVLESVQRPAEVYETNVAVTAALLELARTHDVERFVLASTNAVVGDVGRTVIDERLPLAPLTPYGATKAAAEMLLSAYRGSYGLATCALRLTNVYGPGMQAKDSFVPRLMRAALAGDEVEIYGDGEQQRDFVHLDDVCAAVLLALDGTVSGPMIVGSGSSPSVNGLVAAAREATGRDLQARHVPAKPGEMPAVLVNLSLARANGYVPGVDLTDGLAGVWRDFEAAEATEEAVPPAAGTRP